MTQFSYKLSVDMSPKDVVKRGENVEITVQVTDLVGEIKNVMFNVPQYGVWELLTPSGDGKYSKNYLIPWEAPAGTYDVNVFATNIEGKRGPITTVKVTVE